MQSVQLRPSVLMAGRSFSYFMCEGVWPAYVSVPCAHVVPEKTERASDPLQLELEIVVRLPCLCCELDPSLYSKSPSGSEMSCM